MKYQLAIPSYQRADQLSEKTLKVLENHQIDPSIVTIFVANQDEYGRYKKMLSLTPYSQSPCVIAVPGMGAVRNFIRKYYTEGTRVFHMDDDISEVLVKESDKKMVPVENLSRDVILRGFQSLDEHDAKIFGIYAAANPMFMKNRVSVGLYYCIGSCWGNIIRHDEDLMVTMDDKEDFERTLQYYTKDGKVVRLDDITVKTKYYGTNGMASMRTAQTIERSAKRLEQLYPELCSAYLRETTGHWECRLRDKKKNTSNPAASLETFFA